MSKTSYYHYILSIYEIRCLLYWHQVNSCCSFIITRLFYTLGEKDACVFFPLMQKYWFPLHILESSVYTSLAQIESLVSQWKAGSCQVTNNILTVSFCSSKLLCGVFYPLASWSPHRLSVPGICQLSFLSGIRVASPSPITAHRRRSQRALQSNVCYVSGARQHYQSPP